MKKPKFAVILSGNGVFDGAEIHEATFTLYAILKNGGNYQIFAPNILQHHVINHITGKEMHETRNVLVESARIARGNIKDLTDFNCNDFDALIFPGGFGVAKNFSNFAFKDDEMEIIPEIKNIILEMVKASKPIGALCISPILLAKTLKNANITIGNDEKTAKTIEKFGSNHIVTTHGEVVIDEKYKIATTPCYMLNATVLDIHDGAINVVKALINLIE